ncbi:MAG TPA: DUF4293 domain-containing protein [Chitinophagales bacterium]|nr:DUF4293 domain-containing protein [Chitinophagales bacterium]HMX60508.1 DUF4293 domain-containing protein [Chitinophagales bacterium]HMY22988.1 DUF4293 domain-containing protein [Chitinophagales bacterium]HMZ34190.1 DUF4293 domain-containing protein [Chitinophagales bacterium]HNA38159.1 DUF4293 domain-containing protein [Chitinophagales bacterium]
MQSSQNKHQFMIQRIQTIYLLLVSIACIAFIFIPFGIATSAEGIAETVAAKQVIPIMATSIVIAIISLISIFMFSNRKKQMKVVLINIILSLVLIGILIFGITQHIGIANYSFKIGSILPIFILLFNMLAYGSIKSDEQLVRSMDRLR